MTKSALGAAVVATPTLFETDADWPRSSVTVRVTVYEPAAEKPCFTTAPDP